MKLEIPYDLMSAIDKYVALLPMADEVVTIARLNLVAYVGERVVSLVVSERLRKKTLMNAVHYLQSKDSADDEVSRIAVNILFYAAQMTNYDCDPRNVAIALIECVL